MRVQHLEDFPFQENRKIPLRSSEGNFHETLTNTRETYV